MTTDVLERVRGEIEEKIQVLAPAAAEHARLLAASEALRQAGSQRAAPRVAAHDVERDVARIRASAPQRPASKPRRRNRARRAQPRVTRKEQALAMVKAEPGLSADQIADKMGIKRNYLYRVMPSLVDDGLVQKDGLGYHAVEAASNGGPPLVEPATGERPRPGDASDAVSPPS